MRRNLANPPEVAEYIGKPPKTLAEWRYLGKGPRFYKIGRDVRYDWADVEKWLAEQSSEAA